MMVENKINSGSEPTLVELKPFTTSIYTETLLANKSKDACVICSSPAVYKCPKCSIKTCSMGCSKAHKEKQSCDGQCSGTKTESKPWRSISGCTQFKNKTTSIEDQQFLHKLGQSIQRKSNVHRLGNEAENTEKIMSEDGLSVESSQESSLFDLVQHQQKSHRQQFTQQQHSLLQNAQFRRVWLRLDKCQKVKSSESNNSHHEPFSDTIFWTCTVRFVCHRFANTVEEKQEEGAMAQDSIQVQTTSSPRKSSYSIVDYEDDEDEEEENQKKNDPNEIDIEDVGMEIVGAEIIEEEHENEEQSNEQMTNDDGEIERDEEAEDPIKRDLQWISYTVNNIPETIRVCTLLRQFLRPKPAGPVISRAQLDMEGLQPFISASESILPKPSNYSTSTTSVNETSSDKLLCYLEVELPLGEDRTTDSDNEDITEKRYYLVDTNRPILENLRNRHVIGHPCFVVVLRRRKEFGELELPMMGVSEQKLLQVEREQLHGDSAIFNERPKWQKRQPRRGDGAGSGSTRSREGKHGGKGRAQGRQKTQQHQQPPNENANMHAQQQQPHPHFYHPYVVSPSAYLPPPPLYQYQPQQMAPAGWRPHQQQQWPRQQQVWQPRKSWGGGRGRGR